MLNHAQIGVVIRATMEHTQECAGPAALIYTKLDQTVSKLGMLDAAGYRPERLKPTIMLAKETMRVQQEQRARLASLHAGLNELLG